MKYKSLRPNGNGDMVAIVFTMCCSKCETDVSFDDCYCRHCGHKLIRLPATICEEEVCRILTENVQSTMKSPLLQRVSAEDSEDSEPNNSCQEGEEGVFVKEPENLSPRPYLLKTCPRCKPSNRGCEFFNDDGSCRGVVYPTSPPQYDPCVFGFHRPIEGLTESVEPN